MSAELLGIPMQASDRIEIYSGVARMAGKIWAALHRSSRPSKTVVVVVHPSSNFLGHYLLDIGAAITYLRERRYERVVLLGNSGGGGLIAMYQSQAGSPTITATPAGDPPDLTRACLPAADALLAVMAHPGRAAVFTEFLDPAVIDEQDPARRDPELDLFGGKNSPPYDQGFLQRYRDAQLVVYGTADQVCFPSHARAMYDAVPHDRKRLLAIAGGTHYLQGQAENVAILADEIVGWLADQGVHTP